MTPLLTDRLHFFDLPYELRLQIYEHALEPEPEILACSCASAIKTRPFLGECTRACDIRNFVLELPYPILCNKQIYYESQTISLLHKQHKPSLVVGGTKCLTTLLRHLPDQYPELIKVIMRLTVRPSWSHRKSELDCTLASFDSLVCSLGIGTGKAYTVSTKAVRILPDYVGEGLELLEVELDLSMRGEGHGWLARRGREDAAQKSKCK